VETAARLAAAGAGPTLVPQNVIPDGLEGAFLRVDPPLGREVTVYAREQWGPLGGAFVELMRERRWPKPPSGALVVP
jgi:DNA-binding transcriptional LysR family regulator